MQVEGGMMISLPQYVMDDINEIQDFLDEAGLDDIRIEISANHLYAQCRQNIRVRSDRDRREQ